MQPLRANTGVARNVDWRIDFRPAAREGGLSAFLVVPDRLLAGTPPIVAVHGIARNAREQASLLAREAAARGHLVIAPHFDAERWKHYQRLGKKRRTDLALISLLADVRADYPILAGDIVLSGFSGGAQFAHRFALLHPRLVRRLIVTAAGWYTFPSDAPYPYGLSDRPGSIARWGETFAANLDQFLELPIEAAVGAFDNAADATLRRGEAIDRAQGVGRLSRATRWVEALQATARARGIDPRIRLHVLPDCAHDFAMCVRIGGLDRRILAPAVGETAA